MIVNQDTYNKAKEVIERANKVLTILQDKEDRVNEQKQKNESERNALEQWSKQLKYAELRLEKRIHDSKLDVTLAELKK